MDINNSVVTWQPPLLGKMMIGSCHALRAFLGLYSAEIDTSEDSIRWNLNKDGSFAVKAFHSSFSSSSKGPSYGQECGRSKSHLKFPSLYGVLYKSPYWLMKTLGEEELS